MKITIAVVGRFFAFDLAEVLDKNSYLFKLITTYPKYYVKKWKINEKKIVSEIYLEFLRRYGVKIFKSKKNRINDFIHKSHAKNCVKYLKDTDIFIGFSSSSLESLVEAKKNSTISILERGNSHISYYMTILQEEKSRFGQTYEPNYTMWQRELLEYELADYISVPSNFVKQTFLDYGIKEEKILLNPYGVDTNQFKKVAKKDDKFRVLFVGSGTLRKGLHYLLQAFFELNLHNSELCIVGSLHQELEYFVEKYHKENIKYTSNIPFSKLPEYYSRGSVFVLPSIEEGLALVQLQAMSCELPLICTTNTGGEELITEEGVEGFVIPIRNVESLKEKILYMYDTQDKLLEMGNNARLNILKNFSWENYGERYINNLKEIYRRK